MRFYKKLAIALAIALSLGLASPAISSFADTTVYITKTGKKYHYSDTCSGLNNARSIITSTLSEAKSKGLSPCSICVKGDASDESSNSSTENTTDDKQKDQSESKDSNTSDENEVVLPKVKITKIVAEKKAATVKWTKKADISGYEIQYSTDKNFKKSVKTVKINKPKTVSKKIKKLKSGKKYYFRIRTFLKDGDDIQNSGWSKTKNKKIK